MNYIICYGMFSIYNIIVYLADYIMYDKRIKGRYVVYITYVHE